MKNCFMGLYEKEADVLGVVAQKFSRQRGSVYNALIDEALLS